MSTPIQLPCRKQGIFEQGNWSARILTIDAETGSVAISRKNRPSNTYHHALEVQRVQMWPHFSKIHIVGNFNSLYKSQLALRIVGVEFPASRMRHGGETNAAAIVQQHRSAFAAQPAAAGDESSSDAEELPASPTRDMEPGAMPTTTSTSTAATTSTKAAKGRQVYWMIRFDSLVNYEATVLALTSMKRMDGQPLKPFTSSNVLGDLNRIKRNYEERHAAAAATDAGRVATAPMHK